MSASASSAPRVIPIDLEGHTDPHTGNIFVSITLPDDFRHAPSFYRNIPMKLKQDFVGKRRKLKFLLFKVNNIQKEVFAALYGALSVVFPDFAMCAAYINGATAATFCLSSNPAHLELYENLMKCPCTDDDCDKCDVARRFIFGACTCGGAHDSSAAADD